MAKFCSECERKIGFLEGDFNGLCRECYLKKKEEEKIKEEERKEKNRIEQENKNKEKLEKFYKYLANSINDNYFISYLYSNIFKVDITYLKDNLEQQYNSCYKIIKYIIKEALLKIDDDDYTIDSILQIFNNREFFSDVFEECIDYGVWLDDSFYEIWLNSPMVELYTCKDSMEINLYTFCECFASRLNYNQEAEKNESFFLKDSSIYLYGDDNNDYAGVVLSNFAIIYHYAAFLLYSHKFYEYLKVLRNNDELYTMLCDLRSFPEIDCVKKLYPIYTEEYGDIFKTYLSENAFRDLLILDLGEKFIKELIDVVQNYTVPAEEYIKNNNSKAIFNMDNIKQIFENIETNEFLKIFINFKEFQESSEQKIVVMFMVIKIIGKYNDYNKLMELLDNADNIYDIFNRLEVKRKAKKDKERYLRGDFSEEQEIEKQSIEYSNVQNGYEFEEYVANLYKKLGYKIEEVTKKSGDQGADIVAYKDNIKYVIQVKFYNNPVGNKAVQEVVGAIGMYNADKGIVVTNSDFTPQAVELASANNIELVNGKIIEKYKKEIINNIANCNDNELNDYIIEILNLWNELLKGNNIIVLDENNINLSLELLTDAYINIQEQKFIYKDDILEEFIKEILNKVLSSINYGDGRLLIENQEDMDYIENFIKLKVYIKYFMSLIEKIVEDDTLSIEEKNKQIYYEYFIDNMENVFITYKIIALSKILDKETEDIIKEIQYYKEKFENEGESYIILRSERLLNEAKQVMGNLGVNLEETDNE